MARTSAGRKTNRSIIIVGLVIVALAAVVFFFALRPSPSPPAPGTNAPHTITGVNDLVLTAQDLLQLGMTSDGCQAEEQQTSADALPVRYSMCTYTITGLNDTQVIIELQQFTTLEDLNGSYQYSSLHLYSIQGLISENTYGDQSRFRVNDVNDYGGQFNDPNIFYYHLWICKDEYLIHITSKGSKDADRFIENTGQRILSKFA